MTLTETLSQLLSLSKEMLRLAEEQNIVGLAAMEGKRAALLAALPPQWPTNASESQLHKRLVEEILSLDARGMELLLPWHAQMATMLAKFRTPPPAA